MQLLLFDAIMYALPYARAFQMAVYLCAVREWGCRPV